MTCTVCGREFVNNHTPMSAAGVCLFCRPSVSVRCSRCGLDCPGAFDGLMRCPTCRAGRLGERQYEDRQRARYAALVERDAITPGGECLVSLTDLEALLRGMP